MTPEFSVATEPLPLGVTVIEASAGTGKTFTIAGLFLRFVIEEGLAVHEILVTTYTVAATAELRERIRSALRHALEAQRTGRTDDPLVALLLPHPDFPSERTKRRLGAALRAFDEAAICTIHGFCERVLRERALESRALFDAELLADTGAVLRELAEDYWRTHLYAAPPALAAATKRAPGPAVTPSSLAGLLRETTAHPRLAIVPPAADRPRLGAAIEEHMARFRREWPAWREAVTARFLPTCPWATKKLTDQVAEWLELVDVCAADPNAPVSAYAALDAFATPNLAAHTRARASVPQHPFFDLCAALAADRALYASTLEADFLAWARAELPRRLAARNALSFDDLLTRLHAALHRPDAAPLLHTIRSQFRAALIDEFQDTDPTQAEIFTRLFAQDGHWLFLIGDPKQAIYGFRGADVHTYLAATATRSRRFRLATNQRSTSALVAAVNAIFQNARDPFLVPGIDFDPVHAAGRADARPLLVAGAARAPFRFWLPESADPLGVGDAGDLLPPSVAAEVARLCTAGDTLDGWPLLPRHFAVLAFTNRQARAIRAAFSAAGLPSTLLSDGSVFDSEEAGELHTLLAAIVEPGRHGLIRAALATGLLAHSAAEIDALAAAEREWDAWLLRFQRWQEQWRDEGFLRMLRTLLRDAAIRPRLLARPDGDRALTNLLHLGELLHQAAATQRLAPPALVQWLADRQCDESTPAEEHELRLERDDDAVKIVTVHKSKGLEYDIVLCPFAWNHAALRREERPRFHHANDGLTLDLHWRRLEESEHAAQREKLEEQARLIYVAMTRARHECHFVWGRFRKQDVSAGNWLLHPPAGDVADPLAALASRAAALTPATVRSEIERLASQHPASIAVAPLPSPEAPAYRPLDAVTTPLAARTFRGAIDRQWRISSFTSLTEHRDAEQPDYDRAAPPVATADSAAPLTDIHAFPAGRTSGVCLHAIFERLDFTQPESIEGLVADALHAHGFDAAAWRAPVTQCVQRTLLAPLEPELRLAAIPLAARLTELEFHFPVARLDAATLSTLLAAGAAERLVFDSRRGLLKGFIDLVFLHGERFYIVDWKSNRLGADASAYGAEAMQAAISHHRYALQYHLYTVALHRHLRLRLGASYDYERHFGGVFYLFLRGIETGNAESGIYRDRPPRERIEQLDAYFA